MSERIQQWVKKLKDKRDLSDNALIELLDTTEDMKELYETAETVRKQIYGTDVYIRGLIEISNICKNDCYYCGIRKSNTQVNRYRLSEADILACCENGYELGFRTFVMQGGEDGYFTDETMCRIVSQVREKYPDCAITLSLGERSFDSYQKLYEAGANRYLLRHETANQELYKKLHPDVMNLDNRLKCLFDLKKIGYQVGSGFMVGAPYQTTENLVEDIRFLQKLSPDMIGIGPYLTQHDTPFYMFENGSMEKTLRLISILRLMFPNSLIPATTALGTIHPQGREQGLKAGANVIMPNLSPVKTRELYSLYDNKICTGEEAAECKDCLSSRVESVGYHIVTARGDVKQS